MKCPKCPSEFGPMIVGKEHFDFCKGCRGVWFDNEAPAFLTELTNDFPDPPTAHTDEISTTFSCPRCRHHLKHVIFAAPHGVVVDQCRSCHGVWLDRGELKKLFDTAPGFERPRSKIVRVARWVHPLERKMLNKNKGGGQKTPALVGRT